VLVSGCEVLESSAHEATVKAASLLRRGEVVALPTETVYGLAADARNTEAVEKIYAIKRRPIYNPLIVHVASLEIAQRFVAFNALACDLAAAFWPGPLTLVLPLNIDSGLSPMVTAGLETLAIRVPSHPFMMQLLKESGLPLAAPSANLSGEISPVTAEHVFNSLHHHISLLIDGGLCSMGLESTIVGFDPDPVLLRAGSISRERVEKVIGKVKNFDATGHATITAPGQMTRHYAPNKPVRLDAIHVNPDEGLLAFGTPLLPGAGAVFQLSATGDCEEAARRLFLGLHTLNTASVKGIAVMPIPAHGVGESLRDRLKRAAVPLENEA
jgi:L-threonylcarbamoyladenylate synthase